jgi:hypothetical protein
MEWTSATRRNAMQCNAMQCNAMQCNAMRSNAMRYATIRYDALRCNTLRCNTIEIGNISARWYRPHATATILLSFQAVEMRVWVWQLLVHSGLAAAKLRFGSCQTLVHSGLAAANRVWQLPNSGSLGFGSCQPGLAVAKLWFTRVWQLPNSGLADAKLWFTRVWQLPNSGSHSGLSAGHRLAPEIWDKFWAPTPKPRRMTADAWTSSGCGPQPLSIEHTEPACTPKSQTTFIFDS